MQIDKNVPAPKDAVQGRSGVFGIAKKMEVGDSVFKEDETSSGSFAGAFRVYASRHDGGVKFVSRSVPGGVRVWRIA